jgi:ADP-heptose:LPS heptosyltransferase
MQPKTIAHFRTGIGNFVLFTPALQAMASMDPTGKVDLCTDPIWSDYRKNALLSLWELLPFVNRVLVIKELDHAQYKTWFWSFWTSAGSSRELFMSKKFYNPPEWNQNIEHESDYYIRLARAYYGYKGEKPKQCIVPAESPVIQKGNKKLIVLCNGGFGDIKIFKNWESFSSFSKELKAYFPEALIAKIGCRNELTEVAADLDYVDKLPLTETAKVIQQADLMITTDTGCMHVADALGTPLIVLWGGSSYEKNKPYETKSKIIHLGLPCQPCQATVGYRSCEEIRCVGDITIGEVMFYIRNFFNKGEF